MTAACSFVEVETVPLHFWIDGEAVCDLTVSQYKQQGLALDNKPDHVLDGWYTDPACTQKADPAKQTKETDLYAKWVSLPDTRPLYTVVFVLQDEVVAEQQVHDVDELLAPAVTPPDGYVFGGWTLPVTLDGDCRIEGEYVPVYTVRFTVDGVEYAVQQVVRGQAAVAPPNPGKSPDKQYTYSFERWDKNFGVVTGDMVISAVFSAEVNRYTYTFADEDGTVIKQATVKYAGAIVPPDEPQKAAAEGLGYRFAGWDSDGDGKADAVPDKLTDDMRLVALYESYPLQFTVQWFNGDSLLYSVTVPYGAGAEYAGDRPEKAQDDRYTYEWSGWDADSDCVTDDMTIRAVFDVVPRLYAYSFWVDGCAYSPDGTPSVGQAAWGAAVTLPAVEPVKDATVAEVFTFVGWRSQTGALWTQGDWVLDGDTQWHAEWQTSARMYTVRFFAYGEVQSSMQLAYGETVLAPDYPTVRDELKPGYHYECRWNGWREGYTVSKDVDFHFSAPQVINVYTIRLLVDGTEWYSWQLEYGQTIVPPTEIPVKEGYEFVRWDGLIEGMTATADETFSARWRKE